MSHSSRSRRPHGVARVLVLAFGVALLAPDARSQMMPNPMQPDPRPPPPQIGACTQLLYQGGVKIDLFATATSPTTVQLDWQGLPGDYDLKSSPWAGLQTTVRLNGFQGVMQQGTITQSGAQPDSTYVYTIDGALTDGRKACGSATARTPPLPIVALLKGPVIPKVPHVPALSGWADLHTHPMSNLAFAGRVFRGGPDGTALMGVDSRCRQLVNANGVTEALGPDNSCNDLIRKSILGKIANGDGVAPTGDNSAGAPQFADWPKWNDISHQKMWFEWLRRARDGGLRVMVGLAHNNKALAASVAAAGDPPVDDRASADLQIMEMKAFVARHSDFMEVALSAGDVPRIVQSSKIAVILGIEIDNINDGNWGGGQTAVTSEIDRLFLQGVRYVFPVHLTNNAFGATAVYSQQFNLAGYYQNRTWWDLECAPGCADELSWQVPSANFDIGLDAVRLIKLGIQPWENPPAPPACGSLAGCGVLGHRNRLGMTPLGEFAMKELMRRGMIIDIDHMSDKTADRALEIAATGLTSGVYPLVSGHSGLRKHTAVGAKLESAGANGENARLPAQLIKIANLGGMFGIGTDGVDAYDWVRQYGEAALLMNNRPGSVAFGTDMNSLVKSPRPPGRSTVTYDESSPDPRLHAPTSTSTGTPGKVWSYQSDGVANYGMMTDFVRDVATAPTGPAVNSSLFLSADYFWHMWERCEAQKGNVK